MLNYYETMEITLLIYFNLTDLTKVMFKLDMYILTQSILLSLIITHCIFYFYYLLFNVSKGATSISIILLIRNTSKVVVFINAVTNKIIH